MALDRALQAEGYRQPAEALLRSEVAAIRHAIGDPRRAGKSLLFPTYRGELRPEYI